MSATTTLHFACDGCGKRADVEQQHPNQYPVPEGWVHSAHNPKVWGDFCSEPCLRALAVADAVDYAARQFAKVEAVT